MVIELGTLLLGLFGIILLAFAQVKRSIESQPELVRVEKPRATQRSNR